MRYSEFINDTLNRQNNIDWDYYNNEMVTNNILQTQESINFINQYFQNGSKNFSLLVNPTEANNFLNSFFNEERNEYGRMHISDNSYAMPDKRAVHTVSGFFLGLLIENCLNTINITIERPIYLPFTYLWFLTFLYHDYGYCAVENKDSPVKIPRSVTIPTTSSEVLIGEYRALYKVKKELGVNISPFSSSYIRLDNQDELNEGKASMKRALIRELAQPALTVSKSSQIHFHNGTIISGRRYTSKLITRYFNYCINIRHRADHGIVGGILFYDRMIKNYLSAYMAKLHKNKSCDLSDFSYKQKHYCEEQLIVFSYIADCIISHNIWKQPNGGQSVYETYKLFDLSPENFKRITFEENPLLYVLVVADSLEPIKIYRDLSPQHVAEAINIDYLPGSRRIEFLSNFDDVPINSLYVEAKNLEDWTSIKCSELNNGVFSIQI